MGNFIELGGTPVEIIGKLNNAIIYKPMENVDKRKKKIELEIEVKVSDKIGIDKIYTSEEFEINDFITKLKQFQEASATHIHVDLEEDYEVSKILITPYCHRQETDEEFNHRMSQLEWLEKNNKEKTEAQEREEFERLKKKFGSNPQA